MHSTSSSQIVPIPGPYRLPIVSPTYLVHDGQIFADKSEKKLTAGLAYENNGIKQCKANDVVRWKIILSMDKLSIIINVKNFYKFLHSIVRVFFKLYV